MARRKAANATMTTPNVKQTTVTKETSATQASSQPSTTKTTETKTETATVTTTTATSNSNSNDHNFCPTEATAAILWRDFTFLLLGAVALSITGYVEQHAADRDGDGQSRFFGSNDPGIVDAGFRLTEPLHAYLANHQALCDVLAGLNSLALLIPVVYVTYVTVWKGDYSLSFRLLATQLLRSFCGWFTYLPPDPTYLTSYYDFPDFVHCLVQDCSGAPRALPFVSFFSGHVATMVVAGNHMWLNGHTHWAVLVHTLDALQMVRLLATRGHYSIDIIIGWYMAVSVSNRAGRLGRYYSRGVQTVTDFMPTTASEAFESVTGVGDARTEERMSTLLRHKDVQRLLEELAMQEKNEENDDAENKGAHMMETTAKIMYRTVDSYGTDEGSKSKEL